MAVRTEISSLQVMRTLQNDDCDRDMQREVERQGCIMKRFLTESGIRHTDNDPVSMIYSARNELYGSFHVPW